MADFKINNCPAAICISTCQDGDNLQFHNHFHIKTQLYQTFFSKSQIVQLKMITCWIVKTT